MPIGQITTEGQLARFVETALDPLRVLIRQLQGAVGGKRLKFGTATLTWPGGTSLSNTLTVPHGLGGAPSEVLATMKVAASGQVWAVHAGAYTSSSFDLQAEPVAGFAPPLGTTVDAAWMAVG